MMTNYFVRRTFRSDRPGMYGWESLDVSHPTEASARDELSKPLGRMDISREAFSFDGKTLTSLGKVRTKKVRMGAA